MKFFLSHKYSEKGEEIAKKIKNLLQTFEVEVETGKDLSSISGLNEQLQKKISHCQGLVSIRLNNENSDYVKEEAAFALGKEIPVIIICDEEKLTGSIFDHCYQIILAKGEINLAVDLNEEVKRIKIKNSIGVNPLSTKNAPIEEIDNEQWTPYVREKLKKIRSFFQKADFENALKEAILLKEEQPDCWRAYIAISSSYLYFKQYDEAKKVLEATIEKFTSNRRALSYAYFKIATILGEVEHDKKKILPEVIEYQKRALNYEDRRNIYVYLIVSLLQDGQISEAESLLADCIEKYPNIKTEFLNVIKSQGAEYIRAISRSKILSSILYPKTKK